MERKVLFEIDTTTSIAIKRMIYDTRKGGSLLVQFRSGDVVYRYLKVDRELANSIASSHAPGRAVGVLKKLKRFEVAEGFPTNFPVYVFEPSLPPVPMNSFLPPPPPPPTLGTDVEPSASTSRRRRGDVRTAGRSTNNASSAAITSVEENPRGGHVSGQGRGKRGDGRGGNTGRGRGRGRGRGPAMIPRRLDFSDEWLQVIEGSNDCSSASKEYLQSLIDILDSQPPEDEYLPPAFAPPQPPSKTTENTTTGSKASARGTSSAQGNGSDSFFSNKFDTLYITDEQDVSQAEHKEAEPSGAGAGAAASDRATGSKRPLQNRYLRMYAVAGVAECIRHEAIDALKERLYQASADAWTYAYDYLKTYLESAFMDEWLTAHYDQTLLPTSRIDEHNHEELNQVLTSLNLLRDHTEDEKKKALRRLASRREFLTAKLAPVLRDRDDAKRTMAVAKGEDFWTNNPEPKQTYAEKRRAWEEELKLVEEAMMAIGNLRLDFKLETDN